MVSAKISAVVVAAGSGSRFGGERPKQLAPLAGRPVLTHTLAAFESLPEIEEIVLVLPEQWLAVIEDEVVKAFDFKKVKTLVGGASRAESTRVGFAATQGEIILIHDGVRPLVQAATIRSVAQAAREHGAALAAIPVSDTLKEVDGFLVRRTVDRKNLWQAQTPQGFKREILALALEAADDQATDDIALLERIGLSAAVVTGSRRNLKITTPEDLEMAEALKAWERLSRDPAESLESHHCPNGKWPLRNLGHDRPPRIGHGYDLHRLTPGRPLFLGCVKIPFELGLLGHSDADVLAHALADALLGAAALGDIGQHFPDQDPVWAGVTGSALLGSSIEKVRAAGFELINADLTLVGERPKISPYRTAMIEATARALGVSPAAVSLKATTTEGLESTGRGEALAAHAVVLIR